MHCQDLELFKSYHYCNIGDFVNEIQHYRSAKNLLISKNKPSIIIDAASDARDLDWVKSITEEHKDSITAILIGDSDFAKQHADSNFKFFSIWGYRYNYCINQVPSKIINTRRSHKLSCLNRVPRMSRIYVYYLLSQMQWKNDVLLSFMGLSTNDTIGVDYGITLQEIEQELGSEVKDFFTKELTKFPISYDSLYKWQVCFDNSVSAYSDCYANICTETNCYYLCHSEKFFKALISGNIIFPLSCQHYLSSLLPVGIDINYDGINLTNIDQESDWKIRAQQLMQLVNTIYYDLEDIWYANEKKIQYNQEWLYSEEFQKETLKYVQEYI